MWIAVNTHDMMVLSYKGEKSRPDLSTLTPKWGHYHDDRLNTLWINYDNKQPLIDRPILVRSYGTGMKIKIPTLLNVEVRMINKEFVKAMQVSDVCNCQFVEDFKITFHRYGGIVTVRMNKL